MLVIRKQGSNGKTAGLCARCMLLEDDALTRRAHAELQVQGSITYNGATLNEFIPERTSAYITQFDNVSFYLAIFASKALCSASAASSSVSAHGEAAKCGSRICADICFRSGCS